MIAVQLMAGRASIQLGAIIDSGAARTMFPLAIATALGIHESLTPDQIGAVGVEGQGFPTWSSTVPVTAQVIWVDAQTGNPSPWGPVISMTPAFAEKNVFLLGRQDFFRAFHISFGQHPHGGWAFTLDH